MLPRGISQPSLALTDVREDIRLSEDKVSVFSLCLPGSYAGACGEVQPHSRECVLRQYILGIELKSSA